MKYFLSDWFWWKCMQLLYCKSLFYQCLWTYLIGCLMNTLYCWFIIHKVQWSFPCICHKCMWGIEGTGPIILNLSTRYMRVFSFACQLIYPWGYHLQYAFNAHPASCSMSGGGSFPEAKCGWSMRLMTHLHLMLSLRMSGAVPLPSLYTIMSCTVTASPFT